MRPERRLRRSADIAAVHKCGRSAGGSLVVVRARPSGLDWPRVGFVVGRKVGGAVVRNLVKRRLREIARQLPLTEGMDVLVIARPPAASASFPLLVSAVSSGLKRVRALGSTAADLPAESFPRAS